MHFFSFLVTLFFCKILSPVTHTFRAISSVTHSFCNVDKSLEPLIFEGLFSYLVTLVFRKILSRVTHTFRAISSVTLSICNVENSLEPRLFARKDCHPNFLQDLLLQPLFFVIKKTLKCVTLKRLLLPGNLIFQWLMAQCNDCETKAEYDRSKELLFKFLNLKETKDVLSVDGRNTVVRLQNDLAAKINKYGGFVWIPVKNCMDAMTTSPAESQNSMLKSGLDFVSKKTT